MQSPRCLQCLATRLQFRFRFHSRLASLQNARRRRNLHTSPVARARAGARSAGYTLAPWYGETKAPSQPNLQAAAAFFQAHRPSKQWTASEWRKYQSETGPRPPEVAFLGRSNVGKSSLLNALLMSPGLNRVGSTPGKTALMHAWALAARDERGGALKGWGADTAPKLIVVDMPGYGYASRTAWGEEIVAYLRFRKQLKRAFLLIDGLHGVKQLDMQMAHQLKMMAVPFQVIVSKCDRLDSKGRPSQDATKEVLSRIRSELKLDDGKSTGLAEILATASVLEDGIIRPASVTGVANVQWAILRAAGLDEYAMTKGQTPPRTQLPSIDNDTSAPVRVQLPANLSGDQPSSGSSLNLDSNSPPIHDSLETVDPVPGSSLSDFLKDILETGNQPRSSSGPIDRPPKSEQIPTRNFADSPASSSRSPPYNQIKRPSSSSISGKGVHHGSAAIEELMASAPGSRSQISRSAKLVSSSHSSRASLTSGKDPFHDAASIPRDSSPETDIDEPLVLSPARFSPLHKRSGAGSLASFAAKNDNLAGPSMGKALSPSTEDDRKLSTDNSAENPLGKNLFKRGQWSKKHRRWVFSTTHAKSEDVLSKDHVSIPGSTATVRKLLINSSPREWVVKYVQRSPGGRREDPWHDMAERRLRESKPDAEREGAEMGDDDDDDGSVEVPDREGAGRPTEDSEGQPLEGFRSHG